MNMLNTIVAKSDQINADDFGPGETMDITIRDVKFGGGAEQPVSIYFDGEEKAFRPCKSMRRVLVAIWGPDAKEYVGRSMRLYNDPEVTYGKLKVGGIRISHMTHMDAPIVLALTATRANKKPYKVVPMPVQQQQHPVDALTIGAARALIEQAPDMDSLGAVWKRKTMAPFREELQGALDKRKAELAPPVDEQFAGDEA